eukprot:573063-Amphidinium_carterae.1
MYHLKLVLSSHPNKHGSSPTPNNNQPINTGRWETGPLPSEKGKSQKGTSTGGEFIPSKEDRARAYPLAC